MRYEDGVVIDKFLKKAGLNYGFEKVSSLQQYESAKKADEKRVARRKAESKVRDKYFNKESGIAGRAPYVVEKAAGLLVSDSGNIFTWNDEKFAEYLQMYDDLCAFLVEREEKNPAR